MSTIIPSEDEAKHLWQYDPLKVLPLDPEFYDISDEDKEFLKHYIGFADDDELKEHIFEVQKKAYAVAPYPCILLFAFVKLLMRKYPVYPKVLSLAQTRKDAVFLEVGCGVGQDLRRLAYDGFPASNIVATDLRKDLWNKGYDLFKDNVETFPVKFFEGDIFKLTSPSKPNTDGSLHSKVDLTFLNGSVSVIYTSMFFHLFQEDQQQELARRLFTLISKEKGSIIFGSQLGSTDGRLLTRNESYIHTPNSWKQLWFDIFGEGAVECTTELVPMTNFGGAAVKKKLENYMEIWKVSDYLFWSVELL